MLVEVNTEKKRGRPSLYALAFLHMLETRLIHLALLFIVPCDRSKYIDEKLLFISPPLVLYILFFLS